MKIDKPIAIAIILFVTLIVLFYLFLPNYQKVKELEIDVLTKEKELTKMENYFRDIVETYKKLIAKEDVLEKVNTALPSEPPLDSLIYYFEEESTRNGLILSSINLRGVSSGVVGNQITFSLEVNGSYSAFRNFLESIEKSSKIIDVENISFSSSRDISEEENGFTGQIHNFGLNIKTYSY